MLKIIVYKPYTPSKRFSTNLHLELTKKISGINHLIKGIHSKIGHNNQGRLTNYHISTGHKKKYRCIDFKRTKFNLYGIVTAFAYDPNRNVSLALIKYSDNTLRFILNIECLKLKDTISSYSKLSLKRILNLGDTTILKNINIGTIISNIEFYPNRGGQLCRAAGTYAKVISQEKTYTTLLLRSNELRLINNKCYATIGRCANIEYKNITLGKAGRSRWLGIRPTVRGSAMNAVDHPHGGGEGKAPIGRAYPKTPWGKIAFGVKTRSKTNSTNNFIVKH